MTRKQIPNLLTTLRLLGCPLNLYLVAQKQFAPALALYLILATTDMLDGYLARRMQATSRLGSFLDQFADKVFGISFFSILMTQALCPAWFLGLIITVALVQSLGYAIYNFPNHPIRVVFDTLRIGKWNMATQYVWIGFVLGLEAFLPEHRPSEIENALNLGYGLLAILQIGVFFAYFFRFRLQLAPDFHVLFPSPAQE